MRTDKLICPVCGEGLFVHEKSLKCGNGHCFDIAREGYVNLLSGGHKSGGSIGDSRQMAQNRREFLSLGHFDLLGDFLADYAESLKPETVLDVCCGEGHYSEKILQKMRFDLYGFDLSRAMVRLAAKRKLDASFFVANISEIPIRSGSIDFAFHLFAPWCGGEFARILSDDGVFLTVVPGSNHLFSLKKALYEKPYLNDENLPEGGGLILTEKGKLSGKILLESQKEIASLFAMTPYYYHTSSEDRAKLENLEKLETEIEFVFGKYRKVKNEQR